MEIGRATACVRPPSKVQTFVSKSHSQTTRSLQERMKFSRQRSAWKPTTSFASRPSWMALLIGSRQDAPEVGLGPGDVHEVSERRAGALIADEPRRQVQVIVVEEHR